MSPDRWRRLEQLFQDALTQPEDQRQAWLEHTCAGDPDLLSEVRDMLAADSRGGGLVRQHVQTAALEFSSASTQSMPLGRAGPYRLTREIGRGGMGTVYLGERDDGQYDAEVAVKLIRTDMSSPFFLQRFKRERQALARLQHPNIARIFDSGATEDGRPYIVMELVRGTRITAYAKQKNLSLDQILSLYLEVCRAVSHAHQKFVVHRDIKPGNILIQDDGTPKLLDFGVCKLIEDAPPGTDTLTGSHLMTPDYASPEQVRGEKITASSDIYSLGAVLYELLTGRPPHIITKITPAALIAVCEEKIAAPSLVANDEARRTEIAGLLDTVVLRALHKDPARRYHSVDRLAEDLRRVLNREVALAPTDPVPIVIPRRVFRRSLQALALLLLALAIGAGWMWSRHSERRSKRAQSMAVKEQADQLLALHTRASVAEAKSLAEAAVRLDPDNGPAHNLLSEIYMGMASMFEPWDAKALERRAVEEARIAIRLIPKAESAWAAWIVSALGTRLNLPPALQACRDSLTALPKSVDILAACSRVQTLAGNYEIAALLADDLARAPRDGEDKWSQVATVNFRLGRVQQARESCRKLLARQPGHLSCSAYLAHLLAVEGRPAEALALLLPLDSDENRNRSEIVWGLIFLAARTGDDRLVAGLRERMNRLGPDNLAAAGDLAARLGRREIESALDLLERHVARRDHWAVEIAMNKVLAKDLAGHPRYEKLLERMRVPIGP